MRPQFSVFIGTSLDGYIAREDGGIEWMECAGQLDEAHGYAAFFASVDALVIGRGTYETCLGFPEWPYGDKRVIVMTRRTYTARHGEEFFSGAPPDLLPRLEGTRRIYVDGGDIIRQFFAAGFIDDVCISILPIILGGGIRLFGGGEGEHRIDLEGHHTWPSGLVQMRYRVRPPAP